MKKFLLFCSVISLSFLSVAFADYSIYMEEVGNTDVGFGQTNKYLVEFKKDEQTVKKMYVDKDYELSLSDAPEITDGGNNYYTWQITSTNDTSSTLNLDLASSDYKVNENVTLTASLNSFPSNAGNSIQSEYKESGISDGIKKDSQADKSIIYSDLNVSINDTVITKNIDAYVSLAESNDYSDDFSLHKPTKNGNAAVNIKIIDGQAKKLGDDSIGLEATDEVISDYKPRKGNTTLATKTDGSVNPVSTNYCVRRFVLNNDVIYKGNFNLGAQNGFYSEAKETGTDKDPQAAWNRGREYTGFICGQYYEIDLNGHDLILANGATINAYGSITDSSETRSGNLILESGSTLLTSFVTEGQYHETDIVSAYKYSQDPFRMFRCPYINCSMVIKTGAKFQGRLIKADGGNTGTIGFTSTVTLIGPKDSNPFIQLNSGIITREVSYNEELKNINDANIIKNIMYQKIRYSVYDSDVDVRWISFENIKIKIDFSLYSYKYQMWIPPYFDFYVYKSKVKLHQEFIFMPGVYMYVDSNSEFIFSNTSIGSVNESYIGNEIVRDGLQGVAGMVFLPKFHLLSQHGVGAGIIDADVNTPIVYYSVDSFYDYYNQISAKCDFYGTMSFNDDDSSHTHKHEFGGNINIYNMSQFETAYNNHKNNILLYGNTIFADLVYGVVDYKIFGISILNPPVFLVGGFYQIPLISNDVCLYDPSTNDLARKTQYIYNSELSLIENINDTNEKWFFKYTWPSSNMLHPYGSDSENGVGTVYTDGDSLLGTFTKASTVNKSNYSLTESNTSYINFQGGYIIANSVSATVAKACLGLAVGGNGSNGDTGYNFTFITKKTELGDERKYWRKS